MVDIIELMGSQISLCENMITDLIDEIATLKSYCEDLKAEGGESEKNATLKKMSILQRECGEKERSQEDKRLLEASLAVQILPQTVYRYCFVTKKED
jgi:hypothetical protein